MTDKFLKEIREKISCPQFGDDHYGEWGILNVNQRRTIKRLIDYMDGQEAYIKNQQAEIEWLKTAFENSQKTSKYWNGKCTELVEELETAKAEAIKEFADELRFRLSIGTWKHKNVLLDDCKWIIDNLVKEMVGEDK